MVHNCGSMETAEIGLEHPTCSTVQRTGMILMGKPGLRLSIAGKKEEDKEGLAGVFL